MEHTRLKKEEELLYIVLDKIYNIMLLINSNCDDKSMININAKVQSLCEILYNLLETNTEEEKEFLNVLNNFCNKCENENFLYENWPLLVSSIELLYEFLENLIKKIEKEIIIKSEDEISNVSVKNNEENPLVSIIMRCYNHEKYVEYAIDSVLNQNYTNFEFIIADNGSTDNSYDIIKKYESNKVHIIRFDKNKGGGSELLKLCKGQYIALMCSDDYWEPNKLELQVNVLKSKKYGACFTWGEYRDEKMQNAIIGSSIFYKCNRNRYEWIEYFFFLGNCLCYPSAIINKNFLQQFLNQHIPYKQLGDLDEWITLMQEADIYIIPQRLVKVRRHSYNVSNESTENIQRHLYEMAIIQNLLIESITDDNFIKAFSKYLINDINDSIDIKCEKILFYLKYSEHNKQAKSYALKYAYENIKLKDVAERLEKKYNFNYKDLWKYSGELM